MEKSHPRILKKGFQALAMDDDTDIRRMVQNFKTPHGSPGLFNGPAAGEIEIIPHSSSSPSQENAP